jgi:putative redox protein
VDNEHRRRSIVGAMSVEHDAGDRFEILVRGHRIVVDQPADAGGTDTAPTPTELFVASLASCVAFYGMRYLSRHGLSEDISVAAAFDMSPDRPARVAAVRMTVEAQVPPERLAAFERVLDHCTVHNSLRQPPAVELRVHALTP